MAMVKRNSTFSCQKPSAASMTRLKIIGVRQFQQNVHLRSLNKMNQIFLNQNRQKSRKGKSSSVSVMRLKRVIPFQQNVHLQSISTMNQSFFDQNWQKSRKWEKTRILLAICKRKALETHGSTTAALGIEGSQQ